MSGPSGRRWIAACAIVVLCPALILPAIASTTDASSRLAGSIKDSVGQVLDGVEILIVRRSAAVEPVAIASSDLWGRFSVPDLAPGVYGIAALKKGYRTFIGDVDTRIQRYVEVVLVPMPAAGYLPGGTVPESGAWVLRLPRRTVFRDTEPGTQTGVDGDEAPTGVAPPTEVPVNMRVDQLFAVGAPFPSQGGEPVKLQGNETRVRLATPLGQRGGLRLDGRRESLGSTLEADDTESASSESAGLSVDLTYDVGADSRLAVRAFYNELDLEWGAIALPFGSNRQTWGYESEWQTQLSDVSSLRLELDYEDDSLRLPRPGDGTIGSHAGDAAGGELTQQTVAAGVAYESLVAGSHQVQVGFKGRRFDAPEVVVDHTDSLPGGTGGLLDPGAEGWSLHLLARDAWALSGPFTLLYGLDYQHALTDLDTAVFVPSLGGGLAVDRAALRLMVSYHAVTQQDVVRAGSRYDANNARLPEVKAERVGRDGLLSPRALGYEAELELPITDTLRFKGSSSFVPIQLVGIDAPLRAAGIRDTGYLGDGTAAVGETTLSLVQDLGDARTWVEVSRGQSEGMLALGSDQPALFPAMVQGELTYDNGRWGFQLIPWGTDVQVEYRRVVESQTGEGGSRPISEREMLELRLIQSLMRFQGLGNWRLLMAVRMAKQEPEHEDSWAEGTDPAVLRAFNEGVSAGLSVTF